MKPRTQDEVVTLREANWVIHLSHRVDKAIGWWSIWFNHVDNEIYRQTPNLGEDVLDLKGNRSPRLIDRMGTMRRDTVVRGITTEE